MEYYIYNIKNLTDFEYKKWFSLMSEDKQIRVCNYKNIDRQKCSVAGEKLVKEHIGKALNIEPESLVILTGKNGKPYIESCPIHFNISHSEDTVLCAFSQEVIGADIEKIKPFSISVLKNFFSDEEQKYTLEKDLNDYTPNDCNTPEVLEKFYRIYTLKEAICKKSGIGIKGLKTADALPFIDCSFKENNFIISIV